MKLKNEKYANLKIVTAFGELTFDEKGIVVTPDLTEEQVTVLSELEGFEAEGKASKVVEPKEEEKAPESESESAEKPKRQRKQKSEE